VRKCCDAVDMVGSSGNGKWAVQCSVSKAEEENGEEVLGYPLHQSICTGRHTLLLKCVSLQTGHCKPSCEYSLASEGCCAWHGAIGDCCKLRADVVAVYEVM
jgi:hypothetical protein